MILRVLIISMDEWYFLKLACSLLSFMSIMPLFLLKTILVKISLSTIESRLMPLQFVHNDMSPFFLVFSSATLSSNHLVLLFILIYLSISRRIFLMLGLGIFLASLELCCPPQVLSVLYFIDCCYYFCLCRYGISICFCILLPSSPLSSLTPWLYMHCYYSNS